MKPPMFQRGVLRTNCIDCLDRTNVAQYAYGLAALGHQLHVLGVTNSTKIDLDDPLAEELMGFYERMGDTLAHQYGGSAAHNKKYLQFVFIKKYSQFIFSTFSRLVYISRRYLKRGVNEKGRVANDVETEQILFEDVPEDFPVHISSAVQNRGSIPLFWSQETSRLNIKPDIILSKRDQTYEATRLHFENLATRYGNPIIILDLIKTQEKKPRESILRTEFANAIEYINKDLSEENRLRFLHWDLNKHSRSKATNVLFSLGKVATYALNLTGFFYCQVTPALRSEGCLKWPIFENAAASNMVPLKHFDPDVEKQYNNDVGDSDNSEGKISGCNNVSNGYPSMKPPMFQRGVLRTNCIDCLDRTKCGTIMHMDWLLWVINSMF
ncbi:PREDICTED: phosphoinositide phosphatase SAC3-like [Nicotiana attenuata]|uniref:phosphoinositide phosphatase SAC3-like n=1 Tax=Nicotiana attenuata TaxID=49451 RepID=UPI000904CD19|nr:PREDICTED: phosphoinositide phosphatase SAC3-like [Nicotiana attenuata]